MVSGTDRSTTLLDPTNESVPVARQLAAREAVLKGTVALLDIRKPRGDVLLDRVEELLKLNASSLINCALGIEGDKICISSDRSTKDIQVSELQDMVLCVSKFADDLDDHLAEQFGCELLGNAES